MKLNEHIHFLKICKQNNVIPNGLMLKHTTHTYRNKQLLENTMIKMRNNLLDHRFKQQRKVNIELNTHLPIIEWYLEDAVPFRQHENDLKWINKYDQSPRVNLKEKHDKKLQKLIQNRNLKMNKSTKITTTTVTSNVVNISKAVLPNIQLNVLSKGLKYVPTPSSLNVTDIITNSEKSLYNAPTIIKQAAIAEISTFVTKWKKPSHNNLTNEERKALKQIKSNPTITVVNADKGGKVVVMNRDEYVSKIEEQLTNPNVYESVKDSTNSIKNKICKLTNRLFKSGKISEFNKYNFASIDNSPYVRGEPTVNYPNSVQKYFTVFCFDCLATILHPIKNVFIFSYSLGSPLSNGILFVRHLSCFHSDIIGLRKVIAPDRIR